MEGQLWPAEREMLYRTVLALRPHIAFEAGTWKGGGSTYQIAKALQETGGYLITCEPDIKLYDIAKFTYAVELKGVMPITIINDYSHNVIKQMLSEGRVPDFVFMDGPEDPEVSLNDLKALENNMVHGSMVAFHDWDLGIRPDGGTSTKNVLVRPYIESSTLWELHAQITAPVSVGFSIWRRR